MGVVVVMGGGGVEREGATSCGSKWEGVSEVGVLYGMSGAAELHSSSGRP